MFALGFLLIFTLALFESLNIKKISINLKIKNFLTFVMSFTGFTICCVFYFLLEERTTNLDYSIFNDWRFYFALSSEILGIYLSRKNYEVNGNNITLINVSLFFSLVLVPLYAFFFNDFFNFQNAINIEYKSNTEFYLFIGAMTILTTLFMVDKIKGKVNNLPVLIMLPITLSNSMYVSGKLMQEYNGFLVYGLIVFFVSLFFLFLALKNKEISKIKKEDTKTILFIMAAWIIAIPANTFAVKILAIEFLTLLKRISQIIVGLIMDKIYKNNIQLKLKDKVILILIFVLGMTLYYLRG
jgi:hypothetical protein